ncbi:MAG: hypothetical protein ACD_73C00182G0001 [uncultured bacterium]|nr:MAG: hypothetical protein ACD_73C00182G0001 [uncultured bacterium]
MTKACETVNWRSYGLNQPKGSLPLGPYIIAVSVVSPFIKFKNASKETVDASDELVEEIRRTLMQCGQKLSKHIRREEKEADLEKKRQHIETFAPILVDGACRISKAKPGVREKALEGLARILGREEHLAVQELEEAIAHSKKEMAALAASTGILDAVLPDTPNNEPSLLPQNSQLSLDGMDFKGKKK